MQWFYDIDESDEFEQSIEMRLRRAEAWASDRQDVFDPDTAREALDFRHHSRDGRLGYWTPALVREFLTEVVPERFTGGIEHYAGLPEALRTWLRFLDHAGALHPHGSSLPELERAVDECSERFPAAFADPGNWGPARIAAEAALATGIDLSAPAGVERLNELMMSETADYDRDAMAAAVERQAARSARGGRVPALPAAELPTPERAAALASDAEAARRTIELLDWLGEGRALTQRGNLRKADAAALVERLGTGDETGSFTSAAELPGLNWYMELLVDTGLARRVKQRLVPVAKRAGLARDPLALLLAAWEADAVWNPQRADVLAQRLPADRGTVLRTLLEALLGSAAGAVDLPVAEVRRRIGDAVLGDGPDPDDLRGLFASLTLHRHIDHMLAVLHRFGAVEFDGPWSPDEDLELEADSAETSVRLTELGRSLLWTRWRRDGLVAPTVGDLTGCPAAVMLGNVTDHYGGDTGIEEIRRWLAAHGDDPALLLEAIAANPFRTSQSAMLGAAADAVGPEMFDRARAHKRLRPIAVMLLGLRGRLDVNAMMEGTDGERDEATAALAEQVLELLEHQGPEGYAESVRDLPPESREGMAMLIESSGHPDRWLVELFADEVVPLMAGPGARRRASLEAARNRARHVKRKRKPKRRRR